MDAMVVLRRDDWRKCFDAGRITQRLRRRTSLAAIAFVGPLEVVVRQEGVQIALDFFRLQALGLPPCHAEAFV